MPTSQRSISAISLTSRPKKGQYNTDGVRPAKGCALFALPEPDRSLNRVRFLNRCLGIAAAVFIAGTAQAADPVEQHNSTALWFVNWIGLNNATLNVTSPNGEMSTIFMPSGTPVYELDRGAAMDGVYRYELTAATETIVTIVNPQNNGRGDDASDTIPESFYLTGQFVVSRGVITTPDTMTEDGS
jgi:hypothetical protein